LKRKKSFDEKKMKKITGILLLGLILIGAINAYVSDNKVLKSPSQKILYDDFSSGILDGKKWEVRQDYEGWAFTDEYGLDSSSQNFHTQQNNKLNSGTFLVPTHKFLAGEIFEYNITYNGGEGNHVSNVFVNKANRFGTVGYWNEGGSEIKTYYIKLEFGDGWIKFNDITTYALSTSPPYEIYIGTRTGHNGIGHFDYDNFYIHTRNYVDVNEDGKINILDLILVRNHLGQDITTGDNWKYDVNSDGQININDLIAIRNNLVNQ